MAELTFMTSASAQGSAASHDGAPDHGSSHDGGAHEPATASPHAGGGEPQLHLVDLDKTYPGGHHALRGVSLAVAHGKVVVIIGPSGCGKSTLLQRDRKAHV